MRFRVVPTHQRGIPRPRREISAAEGIVGDVITSYQQDMFLRRTVLVATFSDSRTDIHERAMLPGLFDARCVLIAPEGIMLVGIERTKVEGGFVEYAQGWWLRSVEMETRRDASTENQESCGADFSAHRQSAGSWARHLKKCKRSFVGVWH